MLLHIATLLTAQAVDVQVNISGPSSITTGTTATYTVYVTNRAPNTASDVIIVVPPISNFTISSVTCAAGDGNGGTASCPATMNVSALQSSGLLIPSLPYGSVAVFTVVGTAANATGVIQFTSTATVSPPNTDAAAHNNTLTLSSQLIAGATCATATYRLNINKTKAQNAIAVNGGTFDLVYDLESGSSIPGVGNTLRVPVSYSDLNNRNGVDNRWLDTLHTSGDLLLGMNASQAATGSIFYNLPPANVPPKPNSYITNPALSGGASYVLVDRALTEFLRNDIIEPLGDFTLAVGSPALPEGVYVESNELVVHSRGAGNFGGSRVHSAYLAKPLIQRETMGGTASTSFTPEIQMQLSQTYTWRYTAFRGEGEGNSPEHRGIIFKSSSYITLAVEPRDYGSLAAWPDASARMEATDLTVPRVWLGDNNDYPNIPCDDNLNRNGGLTLRAANPVSGNGTAGAPFLIAPADNQLRFDVLVNGNQSSVPVYYGIWFDINGNGSFTDDDDVFITGSGQHGNGTTYQHPFAIHPSAASAGATSGAVRVIVTSEPTVFQKAQNGEVHVINGEVEDYHIAYMYALPVKMGAFTAQKTGNSVLLQWSTISEWNNTGFEVQHSNDGIQWSAAAWVPAQSGKGAGSREMHYRYVVLQPQPGKNFYRLKQIDLDGRHAYSSVAVVGTDRKQQISLFPNPASHSITVTGLQPGCDIILYSNRGDVLRMVKAVHSELLLRLDDLQPAVYRISIRDKLGNRISTHAFVKQ